MFDRTRMLALPCVGGAEAAQGISVALPTAYCACEAERVCVMLFCINGVAEAAI